MGSSENGSCLIQLFAFFFFLLPLRNLLQVSCDRYIVPIQITVLIVSLKVYLIPGLIFASFHCLLIQIADCGSIFWFQSPYGHHTFARSVICCLPRPGCLFAEIARRVRYYTSLHTSIINGFIYYLICFLDFHLKKINLNITSLWNLILVFWLIFFCGWGMCEGLDACY